MVVVGWVGCGSRVVDGCGWWKRGGREKVLYMGHRLTGSEAVVKNAAIDAQSCPACDYHMQ